MTTAPGWWTMSEPPGVGEGDEPYRDDVTRTFWGMIVMGIALVVIAVAVPGVQFAVILTGAAAVAWATFHLKTT
jgi:hypothetical protein